MTPSDLPDATLVTRLQSGDLDALGELFDRYRLPVYRTALAITRDPAAAADILQDTFLRLHTYAYRVNTSLPLAPWLYRVCVNLSYTWATRRARWWTPIEDFLDRLIGSPRQSPEPEAERSEELREVQRAIDSLPVSQRVVIVLFYLNDLSLQEIADILDCPVGTVKSRLHYGRENLRRRLTAPLRGGEPEIAYDFT